MSNDTTKTVKVVLCDRPNDKVMHTLVDGILLMASDVQWETLKIEVGTDVVVNMGTKDEPIMYTAALAHVATVQAVPK